MNSKRRPKPLQAATRSLLALSLMLGSSHVSRASADYDDWFGDDTGGVWDDPGDAWDDPGQTPVDPGWDDPVQNPEDPGWDDPVQNPEDPGWDDPVQNPEDPGWDDPAQNPEDPGWDDPVQNPEDPGWDDPVQNPDDPGWDDPVQNPEDPGWDDPVQTPEDPGVTDPGEGPEEPGTGDVKTPQRPVGPPSKPTTTPNKPTNTTPNKPTNTTPNKPTTTPNKPTNTTPSKPNTTPSKPTTPPTKPTGTATNPQGSAGATPDPTVRGGVGQTIKTVDGYSLRFISKDPKLTVATANNLVKTFFATYPREVAAFNPSAARKVTIQVVAQLGTLCPEGSAACAATPNIWIAGDYLAQYPADYDLLTHESVHVASTYKNNNCWYWDEGVADLGRAWFGVNNKAAGWALEKPKAGKNYTEGYRVTARFLDWVTTKYGKKIAEDILTLTRGGSCPDRNFWIARTKLDVDALWSAYVKAP